MSRSKRVAGIRLCRSKWSPGARRGRLTVIGQPFAIKYLIYAVCRCECGNICIAQSNGDATSCGCKKSEAAVVNGRTMATHGMSKTRLYGTYRGMLSRCRGVMDKYGRSYSEKAIQVCDEWRNDFLAFREWSLNNGYVQGLSIDRINPDGDYEPSNCRWITREENARWVVGAWKEKAAIAEAERDLLAASVMFLLQELAA